MRFLKKSLAVIFILIVGLAGGGLVGFATGYVITGSEHSNPHGGAPFVALLMLVGAILGLVIGAVAAHRGTRGM